MTASARHGRVSLERAALWLGFTASVLLAGSTIVQRWDELEGWLEKWLTLPARPRALATTLRRHWRVAVAVLFGLGYLYVLSTNDADAPHMQEYLPYMGAGAVLAVAYIALHQPKALVESRRSKLKRRLAILVGSFAAILLSPLWISAGIIGGMFGLLIGLSYPLLFIVSMVFSVSYGLKRKGAVTTALSLVGLSLLALSFLLQLVVTRQP